MNVSSVFSVALRGRSSVRGREPKYSLLNFLAAEQLDVLLSFSGMPAERVPLL